MILSNFSKQRSTPKEWANYYASLNWPVIPLHTPDYNGKCSCYNPNCSSIGKHPRIKSGLNDASTDLKIIEKWWTKWPDANIGIKTGKHSNLLVVDIDPRHGGHESLNCWNERFGNISSAQVYTGGDGLHFYYTQNNEQLSNRVNIL